MPTYIATLFVAPSPEAETLGASGASLIQNVRAEHIQPILKKHGLESIEVDKWYPMQLTLDIIKDIVESRENVLEDLVAVGVKAVETAPLPSEINSIESALFFIDRAVKLTSRYIPDEFGAPLQILSKQHILVTNNIPYPAELLYGYIWGLVNRFKAPDEIFSIRTQPEESGKPAVISVKWGLPDELEDDQ
jgi:hypothetical protein